MSGLRLVWAGDDFEEVDDPPTARVSGLRVVDDVEFCAQPDPVWDIANVVQQGTLEVVFGPSDAGKSTLCAARACCLATGVDWLGMTILRRGPVVACVFEGKNAFRKKIRAWKALHGFDAAERIGLHVVADHVNLLKSADVDAVTKVVEKYGAHELLVDTLAQSIGAEETNDRMQEVANAAAVIRERTGARVTLIHHSGKIRGRGMRGGTSLPAAADTVLSLDQERAGHVLRCERQRDGERFAPVFLKMTKTADTVLFQLDDTGIAAVSAHAATIETAMQAVVSLVTMTPGLSQVAIEGTLKHECFGRQAVRDAFAEGARRGVLRTTLGPKGAVLQWLA